MSRASRAARALVATAIIAVALSAVFAPGFAAAGVPIVEPPPTRPEPEWDPPSLCSPNGEDANCGTGHKVVDDVLIGTVVVIAIGLFVGLRRRS
jgi:hypothetical protein